MLDQVTDADDVVVTERGKPRWRVSAVREPDTTLARPEREGGTPHPRPSPRRGPPARAVRRTAGPRSTRSLTRCAGSTDSWPRREGRPLSDGAPLLDRIGLLEITRETHTVTESIERHGKTLDALHLATALLIGEPVTVATHDAGMTTAAEHLGLLVTDPVDPGV